MPDSTANLNDSSLTLPVDFSFEYIFEQGDTIDAMYSQPCTLAQIQAREADVRVLAELTRALDKKVDFFLFFIIRCNIFSFFLTLFHEFLHT